MSDLPDAVTTVEQRSFVIDTLGCKVNLFESENISSQLKDRNWTVDGDENVDLCIINTCTVTKEADRQSRQAVRRAIRKHPGATIVVTGCYAQIKPHECAEIPGVDHVVPGTQKLNIPNLFDSNIATTVTAQPDLVFPSHETPSLTIDGFGSRARAFLQIQQGCDNGCTFCIIHVARGESKSVLPTSILHQARRFIDQGFREIVLCGIDLGSYGERFSDNSSNEFNLAQLSAELAERYADCRFRWSSIDPAHITSELVDVFRSYDNICPHIHLSLQSASPIILKRMKRRYQPEQVYEAVQALRNARRDLVLSADIMVGFPTETDDDFELTRKSIADLKIAYPHVFAYSERSDTPAARIPNQVPHQTRKSRADLLRAEGEKVRTGVLKSNIGKQSQVLIETTVDSDQLMLRGRMANYLPVYLFGDDEMHGSLVEIQVTDLCSDGLWGEAAC